MTISPVQTSARRVKALLCAIAGSITLLLTPMPAMAQAGKNIAGTYRGLMGGCFTAARPSDCRDGFRVLIPLADDVDAKRVEWERAVSADAASAAKARENLDEARTLLDQAVDKFNRDMAAPSPERR